jgi:hypothetical protein
VFFGSMAVGSVAWGWTAGAAGLDTALLLAAAGALAGIALTWRFKRQRDAALDLSPSGPWPQPVVAEDVATDKGPVLVTVECEIDPADAAAFTAAAAELGKERKRDGALFWQLFTDAADPRCRIEAFMLESWLDQLRQHERVTAKDRRPQERLLAFHRGAARPRVTHLIAGRRL